MEKLANRPSNGFEELDYVSPKCNVTALPPLSQPAHILAANSNSPHGPPTTTGFKTPQKVLPIPVLPGSSSTAGLPACQRKKLIKPNSIYTEKLLQITEWQVTGPVLTL